MDNTIKGKNAESPDLVVGSAPVKTVSVSQKTFAVTIRWSRVRNAMGIIPVVPEGRFVSTAGVKNLLCAAMGKNRKAKSAVNRIWNAPPEKFVTSAFAWIQNFAGMERSIGERNVGNPDFLVREEPLVRIVFVRGAPSVKTERRSPARNAESRAWPVPTEKPVFSVGAYRSARPAGMGSQEPVKNAENRDSNALWEKFAINVPVWIPDFAEIKSGTKGKDAASRDFTASKAKAVSIVSVWVAGYAGT